MLEGAAALALLFAPGKAKEYLEEIGVEPIEGEEADAIFNIHNLKGL